MFVDLIALSTLLTLPGVSIYRCNARHYHRSPITYTYLLYCPATFGPDFDGSQQEPV